MPRVLCCLLVIVSVFPIACGAGHSGSPVTRAVRAAAREWLQRNPQFAAKTGKEPGSMTLKDHDHAVVLVDSWPPGPVQGVIRLRRSDGAWMVTSATTRPHPKDLLAVHFEFVFDSSGKARHIRLIGCDDPKSLKEIRGALTASEKAEGVRIIASREYHPVPEVIGIRRVDSLLFDPHTRKYLDD
jgi:hypothetical protein